MHFGSAGTTETHKRKAGRVPKHMPFRIITMHSAKGLEWPIVIPINSTTRLRPDTDFLYRRRDDSVHFKMFGFPSPDYETVHQEENEEKHRERIRLWYVALTRARELLLLPRQNERIPGDWLSLIDIDIKDLPPFDASRFKGVQTAGDDGSPNVQDAAAWEREAAAIAANQQRINMASTKPSRGPGGARGRAGNRVCKHRRNPRSHFGRGRKNAYSGWARTWLESCTS